MEIAFVTASDPAVVADDVDRPHHDRAFVERGARLLHAAWDDPRIEWSSYDMVVVRSPWDYPERLPEMLAWLADREADGTHLHNPAALIRWNLDKRHLAELGARGVPVVPTEYASDEQQLRDALGAVEAAEVVVKPTVSAGSRRTGRFERGAEGAHALGRSVLAAGGEVMVQPFVVEVARSGESSEVRFDGRRSHGFAKGPILARDGALLGGRYREQVTPAAAREIAPVVEAAEGAVQAIAVERGWLPEGRALLYARYDVVAGDEGQPLLLEAELFEPSFFLPVAPSAAGLFADAVLARVPG